MISGWLNKISPVPNIVGYDRVPAGWVSSRRVIYDHALMCAGPGAKFEIEMEGEVFQLSPESYIIVPPGRWHERRSCVDRPALRTWLHFDWIWRGAPLERPVLTYSPAEPQWERVMPAPGLVPDRVLQGKVHNFSAHMEAHERLNERFNHGSRRDRLVCRGLALEILLDLLAPPDHTASGGDRRADDIRAALDELAEEPFNRAPSIRKYLAARGQSYDHQARVFKEEYGVTPLQYVNSLRILRARELLRDTSYAVQEVAGRLGFWNVRYFNHLFKQYAGQTPTQFRRRGSGPPPKAAGN